MSQVGLLNDDAVFVYVDVGMRDYWKNKQNEFRLVLIFWMYFDSKSS